MSKTPIGNVVGSGNMQIVFRLFIASCLLYIAACTTTPKPSQQVLDYERSDADYYQLLAKIKEQRAVASDYDSIIRIFPLTSLYDPTSDKEHAAKLMSQNYLQNGRWSYCLKTNQTLLDLNYTSLTGHYGASICATEMGNVALGKFHNAVLDNYIEAIWRTGNGQSPQTPFYITSTNDLYAFIQLHQLVAVGQSLTYVDKLPIQVIEVQNPETLRILTWYFDITPQFRRGVINSVEKH